LWRLQQEVWEKFRRVSAFVTLFASTNLLKEKIMRSDLIFGALTHVSNRYQLCQLASKATRKLHKPNTRLQDTTNDVLDRFRETVPMNPEQAKGNVGLQERRAA
jgi:hypothetical protein